MRHCWASQCRKVNAFQCSDQKGGASRQLSFLHNRSERWNRRCLLLTEEERAVIQEYPFLTDKKVLYACNVAESALEAKAGYLFFGDHKMREVYDDGGLDLQVCATFPAWQWIQVYLSVDSNQRHGKSLNIGQKTRFWEYPVSLGLQAVAAIIPQMHYYFTIGPRYIYAHVHNNSPYVDREMNHSTVGGFVNTGFHFFLLEHFLIDLFGEYSYARMHFHAHKKYAYGENAQVGGFTFGGGMGYAF